MQGFGLGTWDHGESVYGMVEKVPDSNLNN